MNTTNFEIDLFLNGELTLQCLVVTKRSQVCLCVTFLLPPVIQGLSTNISVTHSSVHTDGNLIAESHNILAWVFYR